MPGRFQMELIELLEDSILKSLFNVKKDPIEIWKNAEEYPRLGQHARKMLSCFDTTTALNQHSHTCHKSRIA